MNTLAAVLLTLAPFARAGQPSSTGVTLRAAMTELYASVTPGQAAAIVAFQNSFGESAEETARTLKRGLDSAPAHAPLGQKAAARLVEGDALVRAAENMDSSVAGELAGKLAVLDAALASRGLGAPLGRRDLRLALALASAYAPRTRPAAVTASLAPAASRPGGTLGTLLLSLAAAGAAGLVSRFKT